MDLSKAFHTINHELLVAKLEVHGFDKKRIEQIYNYLKSRKQRVKINTSTSSWTELFSAAPQGSVLEPLPFNIYLIDLFFFLQNI